MKKIFILLITIFSILTVSAEPQMFEPSMGIHIGKGDTFKMGWTEYTSSWDYTYKGVDPYKLETLEIDSDTLVGKAIAWYKTNYRAPLKVSLIPSKLESSDGEVLDYTYSCGNATSISVTESSVESAQTIMSEDWTAFWTSRLKYAVLTISIDRDSYENALGGDYTATFKIEISTIY